MRKSFWSLALLSGALLSGAAENLLENPGVRVTATGAARCERTAAGAIQFTVKPGNGWPQLLVTDLPQIPDGMNTLVLTVKQAYAGKPSIPVKVDSFPKTGFANRYFDTSLKENRDVAVELPVTDRRLNGLRIACKSPAIPGKYIISDLRYMDKRSIARGWGFESAADSGSFSSRAHTSSEFALRGKKSLKMELPDANDLVSIFPDITDWTPYRQLRFTLYNPQPKPNTKYRVLLVNGKYLPTTCSIPSGHLKVPPETAKEFILDLDTLPRGIDRKHIANIQIYKGDPETVFYLDEIKLYTPEEVRSLTSDKTKGTVEAAIKQLDLTLSRAAASELKSRLSHARQELQERLQKGDLRPSDALNTAITTALELAALIAAAPADAKDIALSGVPATARIFRDMPFEGVADFELSAAGNERESFQIVALPLRKLPGVTVTAQPLAGPGGARIGTENIRINPVGYIELLISTMYPSSRAGFWPDILVHNQPLDLDGRLQPYWITVYVPAGQKPGVYRGSIDFSSRDGVKASYPYTLKVYGFSLPVKGECLTFFDWRYTPADPKVRRQCYDMMLDCRLSPTSMYINANSPDGKTTPYRFSPHPDDIEHCVKRGMNVLAIWYLYNSTDKKNPHDFDTAYLDKVKTFLNYYRPILEKKGAWDITMINGFDEIMHQDQPTVAARLAAAKKICSWLKHDYPGLRIVNVGKKMAISTDLMDVWFMGLLPREQTCDISEKGGKVCFYWVYGNPSPMLDLPGIAARILAWQAFKENAGGIGYYSTYRPWGLECPPATAPTGVDWPHTAINAACYTARKHRDARPNRNGDGNLFYPDRDGGVLASTRIHNVRDGVEDYEYLALLRKLDPRHKLLSIPDTITTLAQDDYTKDIKVIAAYRHAVAQAIEAKLPASR